MQHEHNSCDQNVDFLPVLLMVAGTLNKEKKNIFYSRLRLILAHRGYNLVYCSSEIHSSADEIVFLHNVTAFAF